jgi:hypothetical protein
MTTYLINHLRIPNGVPNAEALEYLEKVEATLLPYAGKWLAPRPRRTCLRGCGHPAVAALTPRAPRSQTKAGALGVHQGREPLVVPSGRPCSFSRGLVSCGYPNTAGIWKIVRRLVRDPRIFHAREVAVGYPDEEFSCVLLVGIVDVRRNGGQVPLKR